MKTLKIGKINDKEITMIWLPQAPHSRPFLVINHTILQIVIKQYHSKEPLQIKLLLQRMLIKNMYHKSSVDYTQSVGLALEFNDRQKNSVCLIVFSN